MNKTFFILAKDKEHIKDFFYTTLKSAQEDATDERKKVFEIEIKIIKSYKQVGWQEE